MSEICVFCDLSRKNHNLFSSDGVYEACPVHNMAGAITGWHPANRFTPRREAVVCTWPNCKCDGKNLCENLPVESHATVQPSCADGARTEYVLGFMFSAHRERVALIRKSKPVWQRGKLNGIGGKVESESKYSAMVREFREECGLQTHGEQWEYFCRMEGKDYVVHCFAAVGDIDSCKTTEQERVEVVQVNDIDCRLNPLKSEMIENLPWLIHLAIDYLEDNRPGFTVAAYDQPYPFGAQPSCPCCQALQAERDEWKQNAEENAADWAADWCDLSDALGQGGKIFEKPLERIRELIASEAERDALKAVFRSQFELTCIHHSGTDRKEAGCSVCVKKERDAAVEVCRTLVKNVEQPELKGASTLVLYFPTDADREEFIEAFKEAKPNCKTIKL